MHNGFMIRQQAISAIHAKVLRLNSASVAAVSVGQVYVHPFVSVFSQLAHTYVHQMLQIKVSCNC